VLVPIRSYVARHRAAAGFLGGVATTALLGSGVALAAIPSTATGTITACVNRTSAAVRVIDFQAGKRCSSRERTISWSKGMRYRGAWSAKATYAPLDVVSWSGASYVARVPSTAKTPSGTRYWGPLSLRGAVGARGATGLPGTPGAPGLPGAPGADGADGADGVDGLDGTDGADGTNGTNGVNGTNGLDGAPGATGPQGPAGPAGAAGATGPQGPAGATGPQGPAGVSGRQVVTATIDLPPNSFTLLDPQCPNGTVPISGGAHVGNSFPGWGNATVAYVAESDLDNAGTGWGSTVVTTASANPSTHFVAHVICVTG
jgi:hypothetical protein